MNTCVVRDEEVHHQNIDNELVMMSFTSGRYYGVNPLGQDIWEHLKKPHSIQKICKRILEEYDVSPEDCQRDVLSFANELYEQKLIRIVS